MFQIDAARKEAFGSPLLNKYSMQIITEKELWDISWLEDFAFMPNDLYFEFVVGILVLAKKHMQVLKVRLSNF